jgi:N-acetylgalactosamine kinase
LTGRLRFLHLVSPFPAMSGSSSEQLSEHVPVLHSLSDIYADPVKAQQRYSALTAQFLRLYGCAPTFYARAPGRVNLIGEHID